MCSTADGPMTQSGHTIFSLCKFFFVNYFLLWKRHKNVCTCNLDFWKHCCDVSEHMCIELF